ncbi:four-carbon acid sugar kinase family protein [Nakamurella deserti]|uniref:four-carbon acid sugar kinase family protein n=1 Tax=Nakamurella deserti TaxID=2164074 RepID=UPI001300AE12|nr:four-carbon acid sugar kinase family protein [Nakamurella deserti]
MTPTIAVIADDLSGAVESAAGFLLRTTRITVSLGARAGAAAVAHPARPAGPAHPTAPAGPVDVHVVDTDSRQVAGDVAAGRVADAMATLGGVPVLVKKIDSLLRGNVAAELQAVRDTRPHLVVAPALPAAGRTVRAGRVWVGDRLLHETDVWRAEVGPGPLTVAHALAPMNTETLTLDTVRGGDLDTRIGEILAAGAVPVCDAETDDDLDRIAAAVAHLDRPVLVGSAGITAAAARTLAARPQSPGPDAAHHTAAADAQNTADTTARAGSDTTGRRRAGGTVLAVVGSAAPGIAAQLAALGPGSTVVLLSPAELIAAAGDPAVRDALAARIAAADGPEVVVAVDATGPVDATASRTISRALTDVVAATAERAAGLVLTGGETARAVLDRLGVTRLRPLSQVHHGAVVCRDDAGRAVATRPGSFGDRDSLRHLVSAVRAVVGATAAVPPVGPLARPIREDAPPHPPEESA